jgi:predicted peroxiredoxin
MVRRVVSLVRSAPAALRGEDPVLEANAYALSEAVDLTLVLAGPAVELALAAESDSDLLQPPPSQQDLRGLIESGVRIYADAADLRARGIRSGDLVPGVEVVDAQRLADVLADAEAVLSW